MKPGDPPYTHDYYSAYADGSSRSASVVVPLVLSLLKVKSVVDVGCGIGTWVAEFEAHGVSDAIGIDGDYVDRSQLLIRRERFFAHDLINPLRLGRGFYLAACFVGGE